MCSIVMKFKKFRYNLIVVGLIAIVGCAIIFPLFTAQPMESGFGETEIEQELDPTVNENEEINEDEEEVEENDEFLSFKAVDWLEYSIDLLYNGKGFESTFTQIILTNTEVAGIKISVPQNSKGTIKRSGKNSLEEAYFWSTWDGIKSDQLKNSYQYFYINRDTDTMCRGETKSYDKDKMTYDMSSGKVETYTYQEGMDKFLFMAGDDLQLTTNKNEIYEYTKKNNTVEIKAVYKIENIPDSYKKFFGTTGQLNDISYKSLIVTYTIDMTTGKMKSITRTEVLTGTSMGVNATMNITTKQIFQKVDEDVEIVQPK